MCDVKFYQGDKLEFINGQKLEISNVHSSAPFTIVSIIFTDTFFSNTSENNFIYQPAEHSQ